MSKFLYVVWYVGWEDDDFAEKRGWIEPMCSHFGDRNGLSSKRETRSRLRMPASVGP